MKKPNIAVVGLNHGWKFVDSLFNRSDYVGGNLIAICSKTLLDYDPPRIKDPKIKNCVRFYNNYLKMFNELGDQIDGIVAAVPNDIHLSITRDAAERGIHVLLEKPIANTVDEGKQIAVIVKQSGIKFMVGHHRRFSAKLNKAKEIIESEKLGKMIGANVVWAAKKPDNYFNVKWRVEKACGGPLLINTIHDVDDLRYTLGEIVSVFAYVDNKVRGNNVEDVTAAVFKFKNELYASYFMTDGSPSKMFYESNAQEDLFFHPSEASCYFFFGSEGSLNFPGMKITSYDPMHGDSWFNPFKTEIVPVERINPIDEETKHFCKMILGQAESKITAEEAIINLRVIDAIKESAESGKEIIVKI